jgi:hypothetical protein
MYFVLLVVGVLVTATGLVTIGFGIPINAFSLGNTLIITGAVAVVGGLILIGLAAAVRQLGRIAESLGGRPVPRPGAGSRSADLPVPPADAQLVPPTARLTPAANRGPGPSRPADAGLPPRPMEPRSAEHHLPESRPADSRPAETRMSEPRFSPPPAPVSDTRGPLDWLRPKSKAAAPEPAMMEVPDEAPLSPRPPMRPAFAPPPLPAGAAALEPKAWSPGRNERGDDAKGVPPPLPRSEQIPRALQGDDRAKDPAMFDMVWPSRPAPQPASEQAKREAKPDTLPSPAAPPPSMREDAAAAKRAEAPLTPSQDRGPAILKSGVIDGMPYTLYVDGSIEAELPQGTVKFASVDALRAHLEKT